MLVVCRLQRIGDLQGMTPLDLVALHHVDELAVLHQGNGRRRRGVTSEVLARPLGRFQILASEHAQQHIRFGLVGQRDRHCWSHASCRASAH